MSSKKLSVKLENLGLHADLLSVVQSWLRTRTAKVVVAGSFSDTSFLSNMVCQGTVFGPALWNVYVGDLAIAIEKEGYFVVLYADDINCFKPFFAFYFR